MVAEKKFSAIGAKDKALKIAEWLEDKKAAGLVAIDLDGANAVAEAVVVATATSARHAQGLADHGLNMCREHNFEFLGMEGYQNGLWILLDCNDVLINIFQEETREAYRLDSLWPGAPKILDKR